MRQFDGINLAKGILWEEAKGKLRAIVMADGAVYDEHNPIYEKSYKCHYEYIQDAVEEFIKEFESQGYHE